MSIREDLILFFETRLWYYRNSLIRISLMVFQQKFNFNDSIRDHRHMQKIPISIIFVHCEYLRRLCFLQVHIEHLATIINIIELWMNPILILKSNIAVHTFWESVYYTRFVHMKNLLWTNFINVVKCTSTRFIKAVLFFDYVDL